MIKAAEKFAGTVLYDILTAVDALYAGIDADQKNWKAHTPAHCPDGCGSCCVHFEPEVYEAEALYLAVWMLENQPERADRIADEADLFTGGDGCVLFDPDSPYHCTVYGGRCLICRLFGLDGSRVGICIFPLEYLMHRRALNMMKMRCYSFSVQRRRTWALHHHGFWRSILMIPILGRCAVRCLMRLKSSRCCCGF